MRVLFVHNRYRSAQPSGEDVVVDRDIELLRSAGHQVSLFERKSDDIAGFSKGRKLVLPFSVIWSPRIKRQMTMAINDFTPDVIHVHNTFPLISASALSAAHATGVPVVATVHNFRLICAAATLNRAGETCHDCLGGWSAPAVRHRCYRDSAFATLPLAISIDIHRFARTWQRGTSAFIVMTELSRSLLCTAGFDANRIYVRSHPVPALDGPRVGAGKGAIFIGRLSKEKGPDLLISAWRAEFGRLTIVGDGPMRYELEAQAQDRGLGVVFLGQVSTERVRALIKKARLLVIPSRVYETFGLVAVEALSAGVPVVVPHNTAPAEFVRDGHAGIHFRKGSAQSLSAAIQALLDPVTSCSMGKAARLVYEKQFVPEIALSRLVEIYEKML